MASTVWRMPRSAAAWARLRPSARASAKLANSTVKASHTADRADEGGGCLAVSAQCLHEQGGSDDGADIDDEHDRVAPLHPGVEFAHRLQQGRAKQLAIEQRQLFP